MALAIPSKPWSANNTDSLSTFLGEFQLDSFEKFAILILVGHGRILLKVLRRLQKKPNWPTFSNRRPSG